MKKSILICASLLFAAVYTFGQNTYVLIHGAFSDMHAWDNVRPLLAAKGNRVVVINLPGHGADHTDPHQLHLQSYVKAVIDSINAQAGKVILVGHSMAGMVISAVAEQIPEKIKCLVFVAAYLPCNGESLISLSGKDTGSLVARNLEFSPDYSTAEMKPDAVADIICNDCNIATKRLLPGYTKPEPLAPFKDTVTLSPGNFGRVKKYYLFTSDDRSITFPFQQYMVSANGTVQKEYTMHTSHLPFVVKLNEFTEILLNIGGL
jgi:pimeloyl-ACP methyl ester carboxylesterase